MPRDETRAALPYAALAPFAKKRLDSIKVQDVTEKRASQIVLSFVIARGQAGFQSFCELHRSQPAAIGEIGALCASLIEGPSGIDYFIERSA